MQYVKQTITISHYIAADDSLTEEVCQQIATETRVLLKQQGQTIIERLGESLNNQAARGEEAQAEVLVKVTREEITDTNPESGDVQN